MPDMKIIIIYMAVLAGGLQGSCLKVYAQSPNEPINMEAMQADLLAKSGLSKKEGMEAFRLFNQCRLKGYSTSRRIWASCMQPTYALQGNMPSNPHAALQFAMQQTCINSKTVAQALVCGSSF